MSEPKIVVVITVSGELWNKLRGMVPQDGTLSELILVAEAMEPRQKDAG